MGSGSSSDTLYIKVRDYRGNIHKLKMGRLDFGDGGKCLL